MLFPTLEFLLFFLVVLFADNLLGANFSARKIFLVLASYFFYAQWDWRFCFLLLFSTTVSFAAGLQIGRATPDRKRYWVAATVAVQLALLGAYKYLDFFTLSANQALAALGSRTELPFLGIILPVGISFFTFHGISYVVDVYRGNVAVCRRPIDMALYMAFFPQLVAGPIVRAAYFLPQLAAPPAERVPFADCLVLILFGLFKKVIMAGYLSAGLVDPVFAAPTSYGGPDLLLAAYGYAIQIYCDFSGYTDMAIGLAGLLGFRFPLNFNQPYRSATLQEFWRRWHISLSSWLRDYLYKPLGGSRHGRWLTYRNLLITMLLGGIWHGAAWKFLTWGALHGAGLAVERAAAAPIARAMQMPVGRLVLTLVTFHFVCLCWIFFRAEDIDVATLYLQSIVQGWHTPPTQAGGFVMTLIAAGLALQFTPPDLRDRLSSALARLPVWAGGAVTGAAVAFIEAIGPAGIAPFIYFRF